MATPHKWSNVAVAMQSALGAAQTITGITKASPGVVTTSGTLPANGAFVLVSAQGMFQVDQRVFRVSGATGSTFALEGEDSTLYDTFTTGSFQVITFGTSITSATNISANGGDFGFIDTTTIHQNIKTQIPDLPNAASYQIENIWDIADAGQLALRAASQVQGQRAFKFTFGTGGNIMVFSGYVGASLLPTGDAQQLVKTPAVFTMYGNPTFYVS